ncbi:MAG: hypothetical protein IJA20_03060, partial [Methanocorpusculum sp.]|nr:hypothetical protein [Methanocorpusculum sp.]
SGCEAGLSVAKTATSCVGVSPHQRYLRFFLMGLEIWKHIVIQFRSKASAMPLGNRSLSVTQHYRVAP